LPLSNLPFYLMNISPFVCFTIFSSFSLISSSFRDVSFLLFMVKVDGLGMFRAYSWIIRVSVMYYSLGFCFVFFLYMIVYVCLE